MSSRETERRYGLEVYPKRDITIVKGKGAEVWDDRGRRYIDCVAGIGVASVGHANPAVAEALAQQALWRQPPCLRGRPGHHRLHAGGAAP